jgi:broad specificity phosphatase PhoE
MGQTIVLVSHVGPIKAILCAALHVPLTTARHLFLDPATISVVDWGARPLVRLFNAHGHLGWEAARWMAT